MKKKTKKKINIDFNNQDKALLGTFVALIILVAILGTVVLNLDEITKDDKEILTIPVLEKHSDSEIGIEVADMEEGSTKEYIFAVSNFKDKKVLDANTLYDIDITPTENTEIKVYKNESSDNLITENDLLIENNELKSKEKMTDTYKVVIKAIKTPKDKEKITIKIHS